MRQKICQNPNAAFLVIVPYSLVKHWAKETESYYCQNNDPRVVFINTIVNYTKILGDYRAQKPPKSDWQICILSSSLLAMLPTRAEEIIEHLKMFPRKFSGIIFDEHLLLMRLFHSGYHCALDCEFIWLLSANEIKPELFVNLNCLYNQLTRGRGKFANTFIKEYCIDKTVVNYQDMCRFSFNSHVITYKSISRELAGVESCIQDLANALNLLSSRNVYDFIQSKIDKLKSEIEKAETLPQDRALKKKTLSILLTRQKEDFALFARSSLIKKPSFRVAIKTFAYDVCTDCHKNSATLVAPFVERPARFGRLWNTFGMKRKRKECSRDLSKSRSANCHSWRR